MNLIHAIVLGIVQGLTELLPVSSSAHLILVPAIFGWQKSPLAFDIALHFGTTLAIIVFFWKDLFSIFRNFLLGILRVRDFDRVKFQLALNILISCIPAGIVALLFKDDIERYFRNPLVSGINLIVFAFVLFMADRIKGNNRSLVDLGKKDAVFVGILQTIALIPGVSRSGITISAGLMRKFERSDAARFSFLMIVPLVLGGTFLEAYDYSRELVFTGKVSYFLHSLLLPFLAGSIFSFVVGIFSLKFLFGYIKRSNFSIFVYYRVIFGIFFLIYFLRLF